MDVRVVPVTLLPVRIFRVRPRVPRVSTVIVVPSEKSLYGSFRTKLALW